MHVKEIGTAVWLLLTLPLCQPTPVKIFVAQLPSKYNEDVATGRRKLGNILDSPHGSLLSEELDLWNSDQFSNEVVFYKELQASPLRTMKREEADMVYVPILLNAVMYLTEGRREPIIVSFLEEMDALLPTYRTQPHFMIVARVEAEMKKHKWASIGRTMFADPRWEHFTMATIEVSMKALEVARLHGTIHNWIQIPYNTMVHLPPACEACHGCARCRNVTHLLSQDKDILISQSYRSKYPFRRKLRQECVDRPKFCVHNEWFGRTEAMYNLTGSIHAAESMKRAIRDMARSYFCLQPPGDTYSRRAIYDCIAAGTIPVVFESKWLDAFPYKDIVPTDAILYFYDLHQEERTSVLDHLVDRFDRKGQLSEPQLHAKLAQVVSLRNIFSYSLQPQHELVNFEELYLVHRDDDALTASLKYLVRAICARGLLDPQKCELGRPAGQEALGTMR